MLSSNDTIVNEIKALRRKYNYNWLEPIINFHENAPNPFLPPDMPIQFEEEEILNSRIGNLMIKNGLEMDVDLSDVGISNNNSSFVLNNLSTTFFSHPKRSNSNSNYQTPFTVRSSCAFLTQLPEVPNEQSFGNLKLFNLSLSSCVSQFEIIEPVLCSAFLYSAEENLIISHSWHFTFPQTFKYFQDAGMNISESQTASFQIDPQQVESKTYFIVVLYHPMTVENSSSMLKYYQSPSESSKQSAIKTLNQSFPRVKAFTPFAWTYADFMELRSAKRFVAPDFYLLDKPLNESTIPDRILEIGQGKVKQIQMNFIFSKSEFSPLIIPPIYRYRPQPHLIPIHKIQLQLLSASLKSSSGIDARNILIRVSVHNGPEEPPLKIIHSKFNPGKLVEYSDSSSFYHDKTPKFMDDFVIDLPCPTSINTIIKFAVYHVHAKPSDHPMTHIGESVFKVLNKGLIQNGELEISVTQGSSSKDVGKISIRVDFQSTFDTADARLKELRGMRTALLPRIRPMSDATIVRNLMEILALWVEAVWGGAENSLETIEHIQVACMRVMKPMRLMKYLIVFTRYFALRQEQLCIAQQSENLPLAHRRLSHNTRDDLLDLGPPPTSPRNLDSIFGPNLQKYSNTLNISQNLNTPNQRVSKPPKPNTLNLSLNQNSSQNLIQTDQIPLHQRIAELLKDYIAKNKSFNKINLFLDFFFSLIVKSIAVTPQPRLDGARSLFEALAGAAVARVSDTRWQPFQSLGIFALELFDLGLADEACDAICTMVSKLMPNGEASDDLAAFLEVVLRPAPLLMLLKHYDEFRRCLHGVVKASWKSDHLKPIFSSFIRCFGVYDGDSAQTVAAALVHPLVDVSMHKLPPIQDSMPFISYVTFVLSNAGSKGLSAVDTAPLIKHAHFILSNVSVKSIRIPVMKVREAPVTLGGGITVAGGVVSSKRLRAYTSKNEMSENDAVKARQALDFIHTGLVHFVEALAQATAKVKCSGPLAVAHHLIKVNPTPQLVPIVCGMVTAMIIYFSPHIFYADSPPLAKFLVDFLAAAESYCEQGVSPQLFAIVLATLFQKDFEAHGNNHRATAILIRTLSLFTHHELVKPFLEAVINCCPNPNDALKELIRKFSLIKDNSAQLLERGISISKQVELLTHRLILFAQAPAAQASVVDSIMFIHQNANNHSEYINALTLKASLIAENCTNTWSALYGLEHPAELFRDACTFTDKIVTPTAVRDAIVTIPGGCDTNDFSETSFVATLYRAMVYSLENNLLDYPISLMDAALPLLEFARQYGQASTIVGILGTVMERAGCPSKQMEEHPERFFRVRFIGDIFAEEADRSYVYHANNLVNLFDFSRTLVESYQQAYGKDKVELLSSPPQPILADHGYVQVTFLNPLVDSGEPLGRPSRATQFYYDAPFTRDGKSQGTVDTQWLRRTYITTDIALPSIVSRVPINPEKTREVEYEPIRVAYRQIREQALRLERACEMNDFPGIQRLLHGSLLVQVNEGPEKTADAFMNSPSPRRSKLFREFQRFLAANERGIKKHGEWIADKPEFVQLQVELELHLDALRVKVQQLHE